MRVFVVPAAYTRELENAVRRTVDDIRQDIWRREHGEESLILDSALEPWRTQDAFVVVGHASDSLAVAVAKAIDQKQNGKTPPAQHSTS